MLLETDQRTTARSKQPKKELLGLSILKSPVTKPINYNPINTTTVTPSILNKLSSLNSQGIQYLSFMSSTFSYRLIASTEAT